MFFGISCLCLSVAMFRFRFTLLFDDPIGSCQNVRRDRQADLLGRF
jgi:hypothetical protein